jgi:hypothetical protein
MHTLFHAVYLLGVALCLAAGTLVTLSRLHHFIVEGRPPSMDYLGVSLGVSGVFLALAILLFGIQRHGGAVARIAATLRREADADLRSHMAGLLIYLGFAGLVFDVFMGALTYAFLTRIGQGFAVFG